MPFVNKAYIEMLETQNKELREDLRKAVNSLCHAQGVLVPFGGRASQEGGPVVLRRSLNQEIKDLEAKHSTNSDSELEF